MRKTLLWVLGLVASLLLWLFLRSYLSFFKPAPLETEEGYWRGVRFIHNDGSVDHVSRGARVPPWSEIQNSIPFDMDKAIETWERMLNEGFDFEKNRQQEVYDEMKRKGEL